MLELLAIPAMAFLNWFRGGNCALAAFQAINQMVAEDKTEAVEIPETGSVVGHLYALFETRNGGYSARIRVESGKSLMCAVDAPLARKMRDFLFENVRVTGPGVWRREPEGGWNPIDLRIVEVEQIKDANLRAVVDHLRTLDIDWPDEMLGYWEEEADGEDGTLQ